MKEYTERNLNIVEDYKRGMTGTELGYKYNTPASFIFKVLREAGVEKRRRGGKRRETINDSNRKWVDKQIAALTKQGVSVRDIMKRYDTNVNRIAKVRREAGILTGRLINSANAKNVSEIPSMGDSIIPYADNCTVRFKSHDNYLLKQFPYL